MSPPRVEAVRSGRALALLAGAALLVWPALLNTYPLLFSDTHAFLRQAGEPRMIWDKPWIYGPFLLALHGNTTLWLPVAAQGLILSHLLRLLVPGTLRHLALGVLLAAGSAAPWFAALLMPDIFAAVTVFGLYLLAFDDRLGPWQRRWLLALTSFAIAAHLAHLPLAVACLAVVAGLRWRRLRLAALPLALALALLLATNLVGFGRLAISPFGSVFLLARLSADGVVAPVLARHCPQAGWALCAWRGPLPADSDDFLWDLHGPVWTTPGGVEALAPQASAIILRTLRDEPAAVLRTFARNTLEQLTRTRLGDTLGPNWLEASVAHSLRDHFPPEERARFSASLQVQGQLAAWATPLNAPHLVLLGLGLAATLATLRRNPALALMVLVALLANAFATGALSGPHDRYQARLAWILLVPVFVSSRRTMRSADPPPHPACASARDSVSPVR